MNCRCIIIFSFAAMSIQAFAGIDIAPIDSSAGRNPSPLVVDMERIGTLRPRNADEIKGSNWTLGCECLDRDFADFDEYKDYIVPLGVKEIRLFAGWAKCEKEPGKFDFAWLDHCVDWANAHGINVLLDVSYGNPIYEGAGGAGLANGIPNTPDGLAHWDVWVEKLGRHYLGRIHDYAMWNEPDNGGMNPPSAIADLNVRTARILKEVDPSCRVHGLSLGSNEPKLFEDCLAEIVKLGGQDLFDTFIFHGYAYNPDSSYGRIEKLKEICARLAPNATMRQGENGCISEWSDRFALQRYSWSEWSQAKWDMRRMLGDLGHGCRSSVFTICDLQYHPPYSPFTYLNRKGLLRANADYRVYQVKKAYYAVQNVCSFFDDAVVPAKTPRMATTDRSVSVYEYVKDGQYPVIVFWDHGKVECVCEDSNTVHTDICEAELVRAGGSVALNVPERCGIPSDGFATRPAMFDWSGSAFVEPVWIDLFTGAVYALPKAGQICHSRGVSFVRVPVYDSPCVLTERAAVCMGD